MLQVGGDLDLVKKPLAAQDRREFGAQDFDGDLPLVLEVLGDVHRGHSTLA